MKRKYNLFTLASIFLLVTLLLTPTVRADFSALAMTLGQQGAMTLASSVSPGLAQLIPAGLQVATGNVQGAVLSIATVADPTGSVGKVLQIQGAIENPQAALENLLQQEFMQTMARENPEAAQKIQTAFQMVDYAEIALEEPPQGISQDVNKIEIQEQEDGSLEIKKYDEEFATVPEGYAVINEENEEGQAELIFTSDGTAKELEIENFKFKGTKDSKLIFNEDEENKILNVRVEGEGDFVIVNEYDEEGNPISQTNFNNIKDGSFRINQNNEIEFAEFTSTTKGQETYVFSYNNKEYQFQAIEGSHIIFDPTKKM